MLQRDPADLAAGRALINLLIAHRRFEDALAVLKHIDSPQLEPITRHITRGQLLERLGRLGDAESAYRAAVAARPDVAVAWASLAKVIALGGRPQEAIAPYEQAIRLEPAAVELYSDLAGTFLLAGQIDNAVRAAREALRRGSKLAHNNLGNALLQLGFADEALESFRAAIRTNPHDLDAQSNLLYAMWFSPRQTPQAILAEHQAWANRIEQPSGPHANSRDPLRRLRIGYVSPNFREHSVGRFIARVLAAHDHASFEIFCYSDVRATDSLTDFLKQQADCWRDSAALTHEEFARRVREDQIDILVDLTLHMGRSRLRAFAMKPAPIQLTYLAYPGTSGLRAMDYRLTDRLLDDDASAKFYSEQSIFLRSYWCYAEPVEATPVADLPAQRNGYVTFGCLHNFAKASVEALQTWSRLLAAAPDSRMILLATEASSRQRVQEIFCTGGVEDRVQFASRLPLRDYLASYNAIDIALDPMPYGGGTTSCDALWMGCPIVALRGNTAVGRCGVSLLNQTGLGELVAENPQRYISIAAALAAYIPRLDELRRTLRRRMRASPLMDASGFTRELEEYYRKIWQCWCKAKPSA